MIVEVAHRPLVHLKYYMESWKHEHGPLHAMIAGGQTTFKNEWGQMLGRDHWTSVLSERPDCISSSKAIWAIMWQIAKTYVNFARRIANKCDEWPLRFFKFLVHPCGDDRPEAVAFNKALAGEILDAEAEGLDNNIFKIGSFFDEALQKLRNTGIVPPMFFMWAMDQAEHSDAISQDIGGAQNTVVELAKRATAGSLPVFSARLRLRRRLLQGTKFTKWTSMKDTFSRLRTQLLEGLNFLSNNGGMAPFLSPQRFEAPKPIHIKYERVWTNQLEAELVAVLAAKFNGMLKDTYVDRFDQLITIHARDGATTSPAMGTVECFMAPLIHKDLGLLIPLQEPQICLRTKFGKALLNELIDIDSLSLFAKYYKPIMHENKTVHCFVWSVVNWLGGDEFGWVTVEKLKFISRVDAVDIFLKELCAKDEKAQKARAMREKKTAAGHDHPDEVVEPVHADGGQPDTKSAAKSSTCRKPPQPKYDANITQTSIDTP